MSNTIMLVINAIGAILVARMLTPAEYGLYTLSLILPGFFSLFSSWGLNQTLIHFIARNKLQDDSNIENYILAGYIFKFIVSGFLSLTLYLSADLLSASILGRHDLGSYVRVASILIISQAIYNTDIAVLTGYENMSYRASLGMLQSTIKGITSPFLVFIGYGVSGVIFGHLASYVITSLVGILLVLKHTRLKIQLQFSESFYLILKLMLMFGIPLYVSQILLGITVQFRGLLLSWYIPDDVIGSYGVATWFTTLIGVVVTSLGVTFFPTFSKYDIDREPERTKEIFLGSIRYSSLLLIPITCLIIVVSKPLIYFLFGTKYPQAPLFLSILVTSNLFIGLGSMSIIKLLNSQGETRSTTIINIIFSLLYIVLSFLFIQLWNIEGLLMSIILSRLVRNLLGILIINKKYGLKPNLAHAIQTMLSSVLSGAISLLIHGFLVTNSPILDLIIMSTVFLLSYLLMAPLFGAIENRDIDNLNMMFKEINIIYPFARLIFEFERRIIRLKTS